MDTKDMQAGSITLGGEEFETMTGLVNHNELFFYGKNPRVYHSVIGNDDNDPEQETIFDALSHMDHFKSLCRDIVNNGGLIEPIIVKDRVVYEGNTRLAAYRYLSNNDAVKWAYIKCTILPKNLDDRYIYALLGKYHITGKKDWDKFEQAGFLYRLSLKSDEGTEAIAHEFGMSKREVKALIDTYQLMVNAKELDNRRWSYYEEYLKTPRIKEVRETYPEMDQVIIEKIRSGEIPRAVEVRQKMRIVAKGSPDIIENLIDGDYTFDKAYQTALKQVDTREVYRIIKNFSDQTGDLTFIGSMSSLNGHDLDLCLAEIMRIQIRLTTITKRFKSRLR